MLSFVAVEILSGRIIADLPDLALASMKRTIGRYETAQATLPLSTAPSVWRQATEPYAAVIVCLDEDQRPLWGGVVNGRQTSHRNGAVISLVTMEEYFHGRFVRAVTYTGVPQNLIAKDLVEKNAATYWAGVLSGVPIRVQIDGGNGKARDRSYKDSDDKVLGAALEELMGVDGGPEWTVDWEWSGPDLSLLTPVFRVADRLGSPAPGGLSPNAWFNLPGDVLDAVVDESFKSSDGANDVMAVSTGTGEARPESAHHVAVDPRGRPAREVRFTPSTSITDVATLSAHAAAELAARQYGAAALTITADRRRAGRLGRDWALGDDVGYSLTSPAWPGGLEGVARVVGWELAERTITPVLAVDATALAGAGAAPPAPVAGT